MKNQMQLLTLFITVLMSSAIHAQFTYSQVHHWVGTGSDTTLLIVDFRGQTDSSFVWGYLHNGADAETMLNDIAAADTGMTINISGGFMYDIIYQRDSGIGGSPDFWSTWSRSGSDTFALNGGISTMLTNGLRFGCSYTDFTPAIPPREPVQQPTGIYASDHGDALQIYPVPARDMLHIRSDVYGVHQIVIYDVAGGSVLEKTSAQPLETLDISVLQSGIYFIKVAGRIRKFSIL